MWLQDYRKLPLISPPAYKLPGQGRGRTLDYAWDFFCGRMIHRNLTSHPVRKQPFSPADGKIKIDGDSFVQSVRKMAIFFHRR